jgi:hypothetical protein
VLEGFLTIAAGHTPRQIRALRRRIIAEHGRPGELDRVDTRLRGQRGLSTGRLRHQTGIGTTTTGHDLPAAAVRRLACDADLIATILGTPSEVLDLGRRFRLATPAQHRALCTRDHGRTFPGCTRPPTWCDAHHITHWADGGPTNPDNLTLLCQRHHTLVHDRNLTATITPTGVTWHGLPNPRRNRAGPPQDDQWPLAG